MKFKLMLAVALLVAMSGTSFAQHLPTTMVPTGNGGYTVYNPNLPAQLPTSIVPTGNGGYTIYDPNW